MPFKDESFDIIFCGAILHHIPHQLDKVAIEFFRILKPSGKIYFFEPYFPSVNSFLWYYVLSINRTEDEKALRPLKLKKTFENIGFKNFNFKRMDRVKLIYYKDNNKPLHKLFGKMRYIFSEYLFPNTFFVGNCEK